MMYLLAILLPPLAVFLCGKPIQALLSLIGMITVIGWPIAAIHACLVVSSHQADKRQDRLIREMKKVDRNR